MGARGPFKNKMLLVGFFQSRGASFFLFFCSWVRAPPPPPLFFFKYQNVFTVNVQIFWSSQLTKFIYQVLK